MKVNSSIKSVLKTIFGISCRMNIKTYLVGGPVRDIFLGKSNIDIDITVDKNAEELARSLAKFFRARFVYHAQFRTATVFLGRFNIDIATMREEKYATPGALPVVREASLAKDLFRRDFTINALAIEIDRTGLGRVIDFYEGLVDLRQKKIRVLHDKSFIDDPTRIIRALRFATRLNFSIEKKTLVLLKSAVVKGALQGVTPLRIGNEILKMFKEEDPFEMLKRLNRVCGSLDFLHPAVKFSRAWRSLFLRISKYVRLYNSGVHTKIEPWIIYFCTLTENLKSNELDNLCRSYGFKREERELILHAHCIKKNFSGRGFIDYDKPSVLYRKLKPVYPAAVIYLISGMKNNSDRLRLLRFLRKYENTKLVIDGEDLKKIGFKPGPVFNNILEALYAEKLDIGLKTRKEELDFVRRKFGNRL